MERKGLAIDQVHEIKVIIKITEPQVLGCGCVPSVSFSRTRSFIRPYAAEHLAGLKTVLDKNKSSRLMIFGHSDVMKKDTPGKALSERRAKSAFALLTRDADIWLKLYKDGKDPDNEDRGVRAVQIMMNHLNHDAKLDLSNYLDDRTVKELETRTGQSCEKTFFGKKLTDSIYYPRDGEETVSYVRITLWPDEGRLN